MPINIKFVYIHYGALTIVIGCSYLFILVCLPCWYQLESKLGEIKLFTLFGKFYVIILSNYYMNNGIRLMCQY